MVKQKDRMDVVQSEMDQIQRRFRDLEQKHRLYSDDSVQTIRMQRQKIDKLKRDNERLKEELALETRQAKLTLTQSGTQQISSLQDQGDMYQRKIEQERRRISELDEQINKLQESVLQQRSDMGGVNANRETSRTIQKNIRMLENRLDKALVKYNEALGHNKKLRETIDNLRRERVVFDGIYRKLEGDLEKTKNKMLQIIETANMCYDSREQAQGEMLRLKESADKEQRLFEQEWRELTKLIDQDRKMKEYLTTKDRDKSNDAVVNSVLEQEEQLRKRLSKGAWAIVKDKAHIHMAQEKVVSYEDAFEKIQKATGISDIDQLVETFISAEEQNFKLFNQVNNLTSEIDRLEESIANIEREIEKIKGSVDSTTDNQRKQILTDLQRRLDSTEERTEYYEMKRTESLQVITSLKDGIRKILGKIGADESMIEILDSTGVTETNMMEILGVIEQKTNSLIEDYLSLENADQNAEPEREMLDDREAEAAGLGIGIGASALDSIRINPPSVLDDYSQVSSEDDDEDVRSQGENIKPVEL